MKISCARAPFSSSAGLGGVGPLGSSQRLSVARHGLDEVLHRVFAQDRRGQARALVYPEELPEPGLAQVAGDHQDPLAGLGEHGAQVGQRRGLALGGGRAGDQDRAQLMLLAGELERGA